MAVAGVAGLRPRRRDRWSRVCPAEPSRRPPDADPPGALADLDLAEPGRRQLGDEGRQQVLGQAVDRGVVDLPLVGGTVRGRTVARTVVGGTHAADASWPSGGFGRHSSDLLTGRRLVASGRAGTAVPDQRPGSSRFRSRSASPGRSATGDGGRVDLSVGAEGAVAPVARLDELVERDRGEGVELVEDDGPEPATRLGRIRVGALARLGTTMSMTPSACWSAAVIFIASAAVGASSAVRHRIAAQPSGLMTE